MTMSTDLQEFYKNWALPLGRAFEHSGYTLISKINKGAKILDVGCGNNPYKPYFNENLIGIDPNNDAADVKVSIEEFETDERFDVALCLGALGYNSTEDDILAQIEKINSLLNESASVYWRCNPGIAETLELDYYIPDAPVYPWSFEKLEEFAHRYGFEQTFTANDTNGIITRLYAEWHR